MIAPPKERPAALPLFQYYPELAHALPYVPLGTFPTPIEKLTSLGKKLRTEELYIKRDDLTGEIYGGNKVRKLEFLLGKALKEGAKEVLTFGFAGSNHALATSIYAGELGLSAHLLLLPQVNAHYVRRNLLVDFHFHARLHHYSSSLTLSLGVLKILLHGIITNGSFPQVIPAGGSSPLGATGYVNAAFELKAQIDAGNMPEPDFIYLPLGSGGTTVGLALGLKALGLKTQVVPIRVIEERLTPRKKIEHLFRETNRYLRRNAPAFPQVTLASKDFSIRSEFMGAGYAQFTDKSVEAAQVMARETGIILNGSYSAKAFSALIEDASRGTLEGKVVLFWNTYNSRSLSSITGTVDYRKLPRPFWRYFDGDVQLLDQAGLDR